MIDCDHHWSKCKICGQTMCKIDHKRTPTNIGRVTVGGGCTIFACNNCGRWFGFMHDPFVNRYQGCTTPGEWCGKS